MFSTTPSCSGRAPTACVASSPDQGPSWSVAWTRGPEAIVAQEKTLGAAPIAEKLGVPARAGAHGSNVDANARVSAAGHFRKQARALSAPTPPLDLRERHAVCLAREEAFVLAHELLNRRGIGF